MIHCKLSFGKCLFTFEWIRETQTINKKSESKIVGNSLFYFQIQGVPKKKGQGFRRGS